MCGFTIAPEVRRPCHHPGFQDPGNHRNFVKKKVRKKSAKVAPSWSQGASKSPKLPPRAPKRAPKSSPGRVRRVFRSRFRRKTPKPHQTLLFSIQKPHPHTQKKVFFSMIFGSETVLKSDLRENVEKVTPKMRKKCPSSAPARPEGFPGLPQGFQNDVGNP